MSDIVVEIHVPLVAAEGLGPDDYPFPWIEAIEEGFLFRLEEGAGAGEVYDDGEELDGEYLFFVWNAPEDALIDLASQVAHLPGVPDGVYAVVTTTVSEEMGAGRRVDLH
jgi:hypothetical protein